MAYSQFISSEKQAPLASNDANSLWAKVDGNDALETMSHIIPNHAGIETMGRDKLTVPSPWSNIISFDLLLDTKAKYGEVQNFTINEWKTLITLIALRKIRSIPITMETIRLRNHPESFARNIEMQYPKNSIFKNEAAAWEDITLIKLKGEVIGAVTPSNIVCSRYYYDENLTPETVKWFMAHGLMSEKVIDGKTVYNMENPINYIFGVGTAMPTKTSFTYMYAWLGKIEEFLKTKDEVGEFVFKNTQNLITRISDFKNEISAHAAGIGWGAGELILKASVPAEDLKNGREMIESIQGEYSWLGLLTAIAYERISDYEIVYADYNRTIDNFKDLFHPSIINDPTARAVLLNGQCIGVVRNNQLVSLPTATTRVDELVQCGLMTDGAEYNNPVDFAMESYARYAFIKKWMTEVLNQIESMPNITIPNEAKKEISGFISSLESRYSSMKADFQKAATQTTGGFAFSYDIPPMNICEVFEHMKIDFSFDIAGLTDNVTIMGTNHVLFSEKSITGELLSYYNKAQNRQGYNNVIIAADKKVFDIENVFEPTLYYIEIAAGDVKRLNDENRHWIEKRGGAIVKSYTVLWPIKQEILDIFKDNIDILINGLSLRYDEEADLCFIELELPTQSNPTGGNIISKSYGGPRKVGDVTHKVIDSYLLPGVSIWPFAEAGENQTPWESYTLYESGETTLQPGVTNPYTIEYMPLEKDENGNVVNLSQDLELSSNIGEFRRRIISRKSIPRYITVDNAGNYCGAVLFERPKIALMNGAIDAKVSLDFGTSSTAVYANLGIENIPVTFGDDEVFTPIMHKYNDEGQFFIPNTEFTNHYYPSLLRQSSAQRTGNPFAFSNGNIIYKYEYSMCVNEDDKSILKDDIKWSNNSQYNMKAYLRQIILRTLMFLKRNGCGNIEWFASYPSAYSAFQKNDYENALIDIIRSIHKSVNGGLKFQNDPSITIQSAVPFSLKTESVAAAKYCMSAAVDAGVPYVAVIDIGGGSTDMSVWKSVAGGSANIVFQSSVEMASRNIFLKPLIELIKTDVNIQKYIENLGAPFSMVTEYIENKDNTKLNTLIEQLLQLYADDLRNAINAACAVEIRTKFERKVVTGFYALIFYAAKSYMKVIEGESPAASMQINLTGNGSKLYDWIPPIYKNNIIEEISKMLENCNINIIPPGVDAKTEAAQGMLEMSGMRSDIRIDPSAADKVGPQGKYLLCGADITIQYFLDNQLKTEEMQSNANMTNPESTIYKGFAGAPGYKINNIELTHPESLRNTLISDFIDTLTGKIFNGALKIQIDYSVMNANVMVDMGAGVGTGRIMSPLFLQVKYVIGMI